MLIIIGTIMQNEITMENKDAYIDFIIDCFNKGIIERADILAKFVEKWQKSSRSFDRYLKLANEAYKLQRNVINEAKLSETIQIEKEAVKTLLLDKVDRMRIAEEIALGESFESNGKIITPTPSERLKALEYLAKIEGDYAPSKVEQTNTTIEVIRKNADSIE